MPLLEVKPVIAPYRGSANHQFTGGYDFGMLWHTTVVYTFCVDEKKYRIVSILQQKSNGGISYGIHT